MTTIAESDRVRRIWDRLAPRYDEKVRLPERLLFAGGREWVCSRAKGEVLEISVGTGRNLPHYAPDVRIMAVDISASMLEIARKRAAELGRDVDLRVGDAQALPFPNSSFDTAVCTLAHCSIPDPRAAGGSQVRYEAVNRRGREHACWARRPATIGG
jgi:ubiquinone/menaquinone biosynthesis C-methylase UbiE